ncbi:MAG: hypothetical protein WCY30_03375 [Candidatus Neomarinimicrobiota bacterium]|jgi:hypothetical protein
MSCNDTVELRFEGIDDFNRPVFKDKSNNRYGSTNILFDYGVTGSEVLKKVSEKDILYFGRSFGCEPDGSKINPNKIRLIV